MKGNFSHFFAVCLSLGVFVTAYSANEETSLREKAEAGDAEAMNYLGYALISGADSTAVDVEEGLDWLIQAADSGSMKAASNLGWLMIDGSIVEQDLPKGVYWIRKAADAGLPVAQSILGDLYRDGKGVDKNIAMADSLYREAFERGLNDAGYKLYALNVDSYESMTPHEQVVNGKYYYLRGTPSQGVKLFYMAADKGDAEALALLGDAYTRAVGVPYDYNLSLSYYAKAARAGNPSAQFIIGELLEIFPDSMRHLNVTDFPEPLSDDPAYWFEKAALAGVNDALEAERRLIGMEK